MNKDECLNRRKNVVSFNMNKDECLTRRMNGNHILNILDSMDPLSKETTNMAHQSPTSTITKRTSDTSSICSSDDEGGDMDIYGSSIESLFIDDDEGEKEDDYEDHGTLDTLLRGTGSQNPNPLLHLENTRSDEKEADSKMTSKENKKSKRKDKKYNEEVEEAAFLLDMLAGRNSNKNSIDEDLSEIANRLRNGLVVKKRKYKFKTYKSCFIASDAVNFMLQEGMANTRYQAIVLGRRLQCELRLWKHVCGDHLFQDGHLFFRFNPATNIVAGGGGEEKFETPKSSNTNYDNEESLQASDPVDCVGVGNKAGDEQANLLLPPPPPPPSDETPDSTSSIARKGMRRWETSNRRKQTAVHRTTGGFAESKRGRVEARQHRGPHLRRSLSYQGPRCATTSRNKDPLAQSDRGVPRGGRSPNTASLRKQRPSRSKTLIEPEKEHKARWRRRSGDPLCSSDHIPRPSWRRRSGDPLCSSDHIPRPPRRTRSGALGLSEHSGIRSENRKNITRPPRRSRSEAIAKPFEYRERLRSHSSDPSRQRESSASRRLKSSSEQDRRRSRHSSLGPERRKYQDENAGSDEHRAIRNRRRGSKDPASVHAGTRCHNQRSKPGTHQRQSRSRSRSMSTSDHRQCRTSRKGRNESVDTCTTTSQAIAIVDNGDGDLQRQSVIDGTHKDDDQTSRQPSNRNSVVGMKSGLDRVTNGLGRVTNGLDRVTSTMWTNGKDFIGAGLKVVSMKTSLPPRVDAGERDDDTGRQSVQILGGETLSRVHEECKRNVQQMQQHVQQRLQQQQHCGFSTLEDSQTSSVIL